jgi:hypothetical protein
MVSLRSTQPDTSRVRIKQAESKINEVFFRIICFLKMFSGNIIEKKWEWRKTHKKILILLNFAGGGLL